MDIDSDFCIEKGPQLFKYLNEKYGKENCCNIMTFGRLQTKAVIKDIAKVLDIPYEEVNAFTGQLPSGPGVDMSIDVITTDPQYCNLPFVKKYPELFKHAKILEGSPRHVSQHAAGIAITPKPVYEIAPVYYGKEIELGGGEVFKGNRSQVEKEQCESLGIIKLDLLKLKNVTELDKEIKEINQIYGINLKLEDIPLDDKLTWQAFQKCNTLGVFQFASPVAMPVLKKMQCSNMEELAAANSFIRPGTGGLDDYVAGKKNPKTIKQLDPRLMKWLNSTYGALVFQEQVMGLISELMGISFGQADIYRRALEKMHKPANKAKVEYFNENVTKLAVERGFKQEEAEYIRKLIYDNCGYLFNKSHAVCYSYISYYTAYMKVHYPLIFHKTMLNGNLDNLLEFMEIAREDNVILNPPHVSYSQYHTIIENNDEKKLRIGFNTLNGVGDKALESIKLYQPYANINEFFIKNNGRAVNKKVVDALIKSGSFDNLGIKIDKDMINIQVLIDAGLKVENEEVFLDRKQLEKWYEQFQVISKQKSIINYEVPFGKIKNKYVIKYDLVQENNQTVVIPETILKNIEIDIADCVKTRKKPKGNLKEMMTNIKIDPFTMPFLNVLKEISSINTNNLNIYLEEIKDNGFSFVPHPLSKFINGITNFKDAKDGDECTEAGIITGLYAKKTKTNKNYYWLMIRTPREEVRVTIWDNQYTKYKNIIKKNNIVKIKGVKGYGSLSCDKIAEVKNF